MTNLGVPNYFLGVEVVCSVHGPTMTLSKYILDLLEWANIIGCEPCATPVASGSKLTP